MDGGTEEKTFAPGYGEFYTAGGGDVEALALAVPTDAAQSYPAGGSWSCSSTSRARCSSARQRATEDGRPPRLPSTSSRRRGAHRPDGVPRLV